MKRVNPILINAYKLQMKMWGVKYETPEFIKSNLLLWEVDRNKNSLNRQPRNSVIIIKGRL